MNLNLSLKGLIVLMFCGISCALGQNSKTIQGITFQDGTKARIEKVEVRNYRNGKLVYSDKLGFFEITCNIGDTLQVERIGYQPQRVKGYIL